MSLSPRLSALKASQLKHAAFLMGIPSTGTKTQLQSAIRYQIGTRPRLQDTQRIVSVDMGIRNLGICVLQMPTKTSHTMDQTLSVKILQWKRMNVKLWPFRELESEEAAAAEVKPVIDPSSFNPSNLSKTAVDVAEDLLGYTPSHILIERQRFRSGGASAVQEWTLRVNALESMLWAALETMSRRQDKARFPQIHEVSPARVAKFWCAPSLGYETIASSALLPASTEVIEDLSKASDRNAKRTIDKKEKIAIVRSWLSDTAGASSTEIALELSPEAQMTANAFISRTTKSRRQTSESPESSPRNGPEKLDDLADCLLQGVAWMRWQANQQQLEEMFQSDFSKADNEG